MSEQLPDLVAQGLEEAALREDVPVKGLHGRDEVVVVRHAGNVYALSGRCTHLGAPLADGLVARGTLRCPWHHAAFCLKTGAATVAPALDGLQRFAVVHRDGRVFVGDPLPAVAADVASAAGGATLVGGGAAGHAAAEMLRQRGFAGPITLVSADASAPYDRTMVSKAFLAGRMSAEKLALRPQNFYEAHKIELRLGARVQQLDRQARTLRLHTGESLPYDRLLLAPGATPRRLSVVGADLPHVHVLRSAADGARLLSQLARGKRAVVVGASFIGLEVASSLVAQGMTVAVVAPGRVPLERVLGDRMGQFWLEVHRRKGVEFHLGRTLAAIHSDDVQLDDGARLPADVVVCGVGVEPNIELARSAGLAVEGGILTDATLQTSDAHIWAAGDVATWRDARFGLCRVEHWALAQRHGQTAARNMLGEQVALRLVPFFWSMQHGVGLRYVGHAPKWDSETLHGDLTSGKAAVAYHVGGAIRAVASVGLDTVSLQVEAAMECDDDAGVRAALATL